MKQGYFSIIFCSEFSVASVHFHQSCDVKASLCCSWTYMIHGIRCGGLDCLQTKLRFVVDFFNQQYVRARERFPFVLALRLAERGMCGVRGPHNQTRPERKEGSQTPVAFCATVWVWSCCQDISSTEYQDNLSLKNASNGFPLFRSQYRARTLEVSSALDRGTQNEDIFWFVLVFCDHQPLRNHRSTWLFASPKRKYFGPCQPGTLYCELGATVNGVQMLVETFCFCSLQTYVEVVHIPPLSARSALSFMLAMTRFATLR